MPTIVITQGSNTTATTFLSGAQAVHYDAKFNYLRFGLINNITYLSNPSYEIAHRISYTPRVKDSAGQNYADRRALISLTTQTYATSAYIDSIFSSQGVTAFSAFSGGFTTATNGTAVTSAFGVGSVVAALIKTRNIIVLGQISAIRYVNKNRAGVPSAGTFRYYIKSWTKGPVSDLTRTYTTDEDCVFIPHTIASTLIAKGALPIRPNLVMTITPQLLPNAYTNTQYVSTLTVKGGIGNYSWSIEGDGQLPSSFITTTNGINNSKYTISGTTRSTTGTFAFTLLVTDSDSQGPNTKSQDFLLTLEEENQNPAYLDPYLGGWSYDPAGGGGGECFPAGSMVSLANGLDKLIEQVLIGDRVLSGLGSIGTVSALRRVRLGSRKAYRINNRLVTTGDHLFRTQQGWAAVLPSLYHDLRFNMPMQVMGPDGSVTLLSSAIDPCQVHKLEIGTLVQTKHGLEEIQSIEELDLAADLVLYSLVVLDSQTFVCEGFVVDGAPQIQQQDHASTMGLPALAL